MFTAGADVLGCYKSDRLWFLLKDSNQSLSYLPISTTAGTYCQHKSVQLVKLVLTNTKIQISIKIQNERSR